MATVVSSVVIFLILVLVHEFGHFIVAKLCGVTVHEFAIGMGPLIFKKEYKGTVYSLRCIPIGGFCALEGEDNESDDEGAFGNKSPLKRILILVAGAAMNIILGFTLLCIVMFSKNAQYVAVPVIETVQEQSAAEVAGLLPGDRILEIDGADIHTQMELKFELSRYKGGEIDITYERNGVENSTELTPKKGDDGAYYIGFIAKREPLDFGGRINHAFHYTRFYSKAILTSLWDLVTGSIGAENMSGPVGIVNEIGNAASQGMDVLLQLAALITINLGLFNLLPFPALDGGRVLFILIEIIIRKKIPAEKEGLVHFIGFALLILLMIFATWNDITRLITK